MIITDINKIEELSKEKEDENWEFRTFLKSYDRPPEEIDAIVHELFEEISSQIDCRTCANCCKVSLPVLDEEDVEKFSEGLAISTSQFKSQYLNKEEEGFTFKDKPCPFLKDNLCSNYDCRPKECISYPHLQKDDFIFRLIGVIDNCSVCPIVFNVFEKLKEELWHLSDFDEFDEFDDFDDSY